MLHYLSPLDILILLHHLQKFLNSVIVDYHDIRAAIDRLETESCAESRVILRGRGKLSLYTSELKEQLSRTVVDSRLRAAGRLDVPHRPLLVCLCVLHAVDRVVKQTLLARLVARLTSAAHSYTHKVVPE